jgi:hypothetical protein
MSKISKSLNEAYVIGLEFAISVVELAMKYELSMEETLDTLKAEKVKKENEKS